MLSATLVQLTMPGVPDLYQGTETEYRALVDPDNRRPVPFPPPHPGDKGALTVAALQLRARRPEVFGDSATYTLWRRRALRRRTVWRSRAPGVRSRW